MKLNLSNSIKILFTRKASLLAQIEEQKKNAQRLQERIEAAQRAKLLAENQANDLRKDKERLKAKVDDQKKLTDDANRNLERLRIKCEALEKELDGLR